MPVPTLYNEPLAYNDNSLYNGPIIPATAVELAERRVVDRVVIVNRSGVPYAELSRFELGSLKWALGPAHSATFSVSLLDPAVGAIRTKTREVQFWREGECIWWGRIDKARRNGDRVEVGAVGLWDYLRWRHFGPAYVNRLTNPSFETGLFPPWAVNSAIGEISDFAVRGDHSALIHTPISLTTSYVHQTYTETHTGSPGNVVAFRVAAWAWIEDRSELVIDTALMARTTVGGTYYHHVADQITPQTPTGKWVRFEPQDSIEAPTGETFDISVRGYCPGRIYWDEFFLGPEVFIGSDTDVDLNVIIANVVNHALSKDGALNMTYNGATVGTSGTRIYDLSGHGSIERALQEFVESDIAEFDIGWNAAATTRTVDLHVPRKGSHKPIYALDDGPGGRIVDLDGWEEGTMQSISKPRVLGQGEGVDREYAEAIDTSLTDGVVFESVRSAPQEVPLSGLDAMAAEDLARARQPVRTPTVKCLATGLLGNVVVGDTVPVRINHAGWPPSVDETLRIASLELDANDILTVGLVTP